MRNRAALRPTALRRTVVIRTNLPSKDKLMNTLETSLLFRSAGISCIPTTKDKKPMVKWSNYTTQLPTEDELSKWFIIKPTSIAVIAGKVQCLDVDIKNAPDGEKLWTIFLTRVEAVGLGSLIDRLVIQRTPTGGYHAVWTCDAPLRNHKLAETADHQTLIETRGTGGYFLIDPSPGYTVIQGSWKDLPHLTEEERDDILAVARSFNERAPAESPSAANGAGKPGDDFDARCDMPALLEKHGWTRCGAGDKYWTRPGKTKGVSASWDVIPGRFWVFSSSTEFQAEHVYRPWHVLSILEHGGDFKACSSALGKQGYGAPASKPVPSAAALAAAKAALAKPAPVLPPILSVDDEEKQFWPTPPVLIEHVLYQGAKMMIAGPSKCRKTYLLTHIALCVASGKDWLGMKTTQAPVLYLNLELQAFASRDRRRAIAHAAEIPNGGKGLPLYFWHLRGFRAQLAMVQQRLIDFCKEKEIGLVVIDPTYKLNNAGQENSAEDVGSLLSEFEAIAREADCSILFSHHFAKGDASQKNSIDRASGSGVWARDPDAIVTFSPHEDDEKLIVEMHLRNFAPQPPFVISWTYPCWERDMHADPTKLAAPPSAKPKRVKPSAAEAPAGPVGRPAKAEDGEIDAWFAANEDKHATTTALMLAAAAQFGISSRTAQRYFNARRHQ